MFNTYLMQAPKNLISAIQSGSAYVSGGVVRSAGNSHILAHMEQINNLPVSELLNSSNPLSPIFSMVKTIQNQKMIGQLSNITNMVNNLQVLSWANIALTGVSLGVSVVGFMVINDKLNKISKQLENIEKKLNSLDNKVTALLINENRKLLKETKNYIEKSINYLNLLEEKGLTESLEQRILDTKTEFKNHIEDLISRYKNSELIGLPIDLISVAYCTYLDISKAYLTSKYLVLDKIYSPEREIIFIKNELISKAISNHIYNDYMDNTEHLFTETQLELITKLFQELASDNYNKVTSHYEILSNTPVEKFKEWKNNIKLLPPGNELVLIGHNIV